MRYIRFPVGAFWNRHELEVRSLTIVELLALNTQKFTGLCDPDHAPNIGEFFQGS